MRGQLSWLARPKFGSLSVSSVWKHIEYGFGRLSRRNDGITYFEDYILLEDRAGMTLCSSELFDRCLGYS